MSLILNTKPTRWKVSILRFVVLLVISNEETDSYLQALFDIMLEAVIFP